MVDILLSSFFLYTLFLGTHRGLLEILIKLSGIGAGLFLSLRYAPSVFSFLSGYFHGEKIFLYVFSFLSIFIPVLSLFLFLNLFIQKHIKKKRKLSITDKLLGGITAVIFFVGTVLFINHSAKNYPLLKEITEKSKIIKIFQHI